MDFVSHIPISDVSGLRPVTWICVGGGVAREEVKDVVLKQGRGIVSDAIISLDDLCRRCVAVPKEKLLSRSARMDVLRALMSERRISSNLIELRRLRRQDGFFKRLDRAMKTGRRSFANTEEYEVHDGRLEMVLASLGGARPLRAEVRALSLAYEAWLAASGFWDTSRLLRAASERLREPGELPPGFPKKIIYFSAETMESLEHDFWDALGARVSVQKVGPLYDNHQDKFQKQIYLERWHSFDDAAESLAERLSLITDADELDANAIMVPDEPKIRRTLMRALSSRNVAVLDPRDPMALRVDEQIKCAMLALEVVGKNFERDLVVSWLKMVLDDKERVACVAEINARGIRNGLSSYRVGILDAVATRLKELDGLFGGRKKIDELASSHLSLLRKLDTDPLILKFFETFWDEACDDCVRLGDGDGDGDGDRRAPLLFWLSRLRSRLSDSSPPVLPLRPVSGVSINRLGQVSLRRFVRIWIFGLSAEWINGSGVGDYWYSASEREKLAGEFELRSQREQRAERLAVLGYSIVSTKNICFLDAHYDWDGRERLPLSSALHEYEAKLKIDALTDKEMGAHRRFISSAGAIRTAQPQCVELGPHVFSKTPERRISATEIDNFSRCGLRGLGAGRWRVYDVRLPGIDLWPEERGSLLHKAVRLLLESRDEEGGFGITSCVALEEAWALIRPRGLLTGKRLMEQTKSKLCSVLEVFCAKEVEYRTRSGARVLSLEGPELIIKYDGCDLVGVPDRIDESQDGLFVVDYKSSSALAKGVDILEKGYRLQLPFYAIAASRHFGQEVVGAQYVELNSKGGRAQGIFFKKFNGKEAGKLTNTRSKLSVLECEPDEVWARCEEHLRAHLGDYLSGRFVVGPKNIAECRTCSFQDLCGRRRVSGGAGSAIDE